MMLDPALLFALLALAITVGIIAVIEVRRARARRADDRPRGRVVPFRPAAEDTEETDWVLPPIIDFPQSEPIPTDLPHAPAEQEPFGGGRFGGAGAGRAWEDAPTDPVDASTMCVAPDPAPDSVCDASDTGATCDAGGYDGGGDGGGDGGDGGGGGE